MHVINLSFGEYANVDDYGRFTAMARQAVFKHGLIFVTSAGNNGPALTTGGAPGNPNPNPNLNPNPNANPKSNPNP